MKMERKDIGKIVRNLATKAVTGSAEANDGSNAVAGVISDNIFDNSEGYRGLILPLAKTVKATRGPTVKLRSTVNVLANEPSTGIRSYWIDEADASTASKIAFQGQVVELGKMVTRVPVTEELVEDLDEEIGETFIEDATESQIYKIEHEMLMGMGSIKGVMTIGDNATMSIAVSNPYAPTETELLNMFGAMHPLSRDAEWYVCKDVYQVIISITYTTPNALQFEDGDYYLMGYKVVQLAHLEASPYTICLGDFSHYCLGYLDPRKQKSDAVRFLEGEREYRLSLRVAGNTIGNKAVLDDGNTYGWFVVAEGTAANESSSSSDSTDSSGSSKSSVSSVSSVSSYSSGSSVSSVSSISSLGHSESSASSMSPQSESSNSSKSGI